MILFMQVKGHFSCVIFLFVMCFLVGHLVGTVKVMDRTVQNNSIQTCLTDIEQASSSTSHKVTTMCRLIVVAEANTVNASRLTST